MAFRIRKFNPKLYEPSTRFNVVLEDWPFVIGFSLVGFFVPFFIKPRMFGIPLPILSWFACLAIGIAFFNWTRLGKRAGFLQHWLTDIRNGTTRRGWLPSDRYDSKSRPATCTIPPARP